MKPFDFTMPAAALAFQVSERTYAVPSWLAGILMICGLIFLIGIIPIVVLFMTTIECRRRPRNESE